jgi:hypothetical protein
VALRTTRGWNLAVAASAVTVIVAALALGIDWLTTDASRVTLYSNDSPVRRVELRLQGGDAVVVGSGSNAVQVRRTDRYSFGHSAQESRSLTSHGVLQITSRCPRIVLGSCSTSYEIAVPETVAVDVHTSSGDIRLNGFRGSAELSSRSGNVEVEAYCGFDLGAASGSGAVRIAAACSPRRLSLRSNSGDVSAHVPPGRYRVSATGAPGQARVSGLIADRRAPFSIDAHSGTGAVTVEGGL